MKKKHRYFPVEVKLAAVKRVATGEAVLTVARDIVAGEGIPDILRTPL